MNNFKITHVLSAFVASAGLLLLISGCNRGTDGGETAIERCDVYNNNKDACNKATQKDQQQCEYDDASKVCAIKVASDTCAKKDQAACEESDACTYDAAASVCKVADATIRGTCGAIQNATGCAKKAGCLFQPSSSSCIAVEDKTLVYKNITPLAASATTYTSNGVSQLVIADDKSHVYVVNQLGKEIAIFHNTNVANLNSAANWSRETARGAGVTNPPGDPAVDQVDLNNANAEVVHAYAAPQGAIFTINKSTGNQRQGIALFLGPNKVKTYDTSLLTSIAPNAGGNDAGNGALGLAVIAHDGTDAPNILALHKNGKTGGFVEVAAGGPIVGTVGGNVNGSNALPMAFATSGDVHFIAKANGHIDRLIKAAVADNSDFIKGAGTDYDRKHNGNNSWGFGNGVENNRAIQALAYSNGNLYIGINSSGTDDKGGVVIIQGATAAAGTAVPPHATTKNAAIFNFAVHSSGDVYAMADDKIFVFRGANTEPVGVIDNALVTDAAHKGNDTDGDAKPGWLGADLSTFTHMGSGVWLNNDVLLVGDNGAGLFTIDFNHSKQVKVKK